MYNTIILKLITDKNLKFFTLLSMNIFLRTRFSELEAQDMGPASSLLRAAQENFYKI